jgi:NAD(P)-dependent dehydrogenase (short-subunit alcohol dehydrogenase family)
VTTTTGRVSGKIVLVTGAGSGIGRETAARFAAEGAVVAATDIQLEAAQETATAIAGDAIALELDVRAPASVEAALHDLVSQLGGLDVVVNNAGVAARGTVERLTEAEWDLGIDTNLKSVYLVSKVAWPFLVERGGGSILCTASVAGLWAIPDDAAYCVSKAGVIMLTKCMALDGARMGIRVNCVCPGYTETALSERWLRDQPDPEAARREESARHPLGRMGKPRDIADAFLYLASDEASWVTGAALVVDGGLTSGIWPP